MTSEQLQKRKKRWIYGETILRVKTQRGGGTTATRYGVFVGTRGQNAIFLNFDGEQHSQYFTAESVVDARAVSLASILRILNRER